MSDQHRGAGDGLAMRDAAAPALALAEGLDEPVTARGHLLIEVTREDGTVDAREVDNLILTLGRNMIADRLLASPTLGVPTHMSVGTSGTAAAVGDTTITGEVRVALTSKTRGANNVITFVGDWAAGVATATLQEAGLHDAVSAGSLLGRAVFAAIGKGANDTLKITWTWTIG